MTGRPSDTALWRSVEATLRDTVLPQIDDEWARSVTIQLVGLAAYARTRSDDPSSEHTAQLRGALAALATNPLVPTDQDDPWAAASSGLVAAVGRSGPDADQVRDVLRPILRAQLDEEFTAHSGLLAAWRGRIADA